MGFQTVVVGVDGSECSQRALDAALAVTEAGGTIHVVSAFDTPSTRMVNEVYASVPAEYVANIDLLAEPRGKLEDAVRHASDRGFTIVDHFVDDDPASAILDTATDVTADLIVVGSRGLGRASQVLRGSVSTKIAHHSQIDFLVIH